MKILNREDLLDILYGGAILGTGGGGSLISGIECIDLALSKGKTFKLVSFDELNADDIIVCPYSCGAISPLSEEERKKYEGLPVYEDTYHIKALEVMPDHIHIFVDVPQTAASCDVAKTFKDISAIELFKAFPQLI